ncbi:MAG: VWA domain-containing protein [Lamprocystis purpurea]|jgi:Mg-chelatase subunit ChlD|uniref:vWA domain-containing protein n=1 Tax=Lamprocystis purpurea TaxID=61598 RepID=UPI0003679D79|nr:vWA domain-containing protein [Lamprocystis purpurea]MBV5275246.1 VWA domain-containing protein [Lamprocystis purpurea]
MNTKLVGLALFGLTAAAVTAYPALTRTPVPHPGDQDPAIVLPHPGRRPVVEAVFVLDTTGSMGGLIQAAKDKVWSIASTLASAQPAPEVRMGLVAYRDRGDDYVTRVIDLSPDLDQIQAELFKLQAQGGGDGPESVNQALHEAVTRIGWSRDPAVYRVVFLVGDAPPHQDYPNDVPYAQTLAEAGRRGIRVNTIQCGQQPDTRGEWQRIAQLGNGGYFQVDQAGSAVAITTPYDAPLAKLSAELDGTRLYFGSADERAKRNDAVDAAKAVQAASAPAVLARRAEFVASESGASSLLGDQELVEAVTSGRVDLDKLQPEQLPQPLAELDSDARARVVKETAQRRDALRVQIQDISAKRAGYLKQEVEAAGGAEDSLDHQVWNAVREQGADAGLSYGTGGPKY